MDNNLSYFSLSAFIGCTFEKFSDIVLKDDFYMTLLTKKKATFKTCETLCLNDYKNAKEGHILQHFSWWSSDLYPNVVFLSSNKTDGLFSGCCSFQEAIKCDCIMCTMSTSRCSYPKNSFEYIHSNGDIRIIMALKEDRWTFFQQGEPLPFENLEYYNSKRIKDRINFDIIKEYLLKLGIDFYKIDSSVSDCSTFIRTEWGC